MYTYKANCTRVLDSRKLSTVHEIYNVICSRVCPNEKFNLYYLKRIDEHILSVTYEEFISTNKEYCIDKMIEVMNRKYFSGWMFNENNSLQVAIVQ